MPNYKADFPYPVLIANGDDYLPGCQFAIATGTTLSADATIDISVTYSLSSNLLKDLISNDQAAVIIKAESAGVSYARIFPFDHASASQTLKIASLEVMDKIELQGQIVAISPLKIDGNNAELNSDYFHDMIFSFEKGDILAVSETEILYLDDSELKKPISSIFSVSKEDQDQDVIPYYDGEKIQINLRAELYDFYYRYAYENGGMLERFANGAIIFPVLVEAICIMRADPMNCDTRWCRSIIDKCEKRGIKIFDADLSAVTLADTLLGGISLSCMRAFDNAANSEINSGDLIEERGTD